MMKRAVEKVHVVFRVLSWIHQMACICMKQKTLARKKSMQQHHYFSLTPTIFSGTILFVQWYTGRTWSKNSFLVVFLPLINGTIAPSACTYTTLCNTGCSLIKLCIRCGIRMTDRITLLSSCFFVDKCN